jgi:hypothetical protein
MNNCKKCGAPIEGKRTDSKFCSEKCKSQYWNEQKKNTPKKESYLQQSIKGVVNKNTPDEINKSKFRITTVQVETLQYTELKKAITSLTAQKISIEKEYDKRIKDFNETYNVNIPAGIAAGGLFGGLIGDPNFDKPGNMVKGALLGSFIMIALTHLTKERRENDNLKNLRLLKERLNVLKQPYSRICLELANKSLELKSVQQFEIKEIETPIPSEEISVNSESQNETGIRINNENALSGNRLNDYDTDKKSIPENDKVIPVKVLANKQYKELDFKGQWFDLFGNPSIDFHCAIYGNPGSGKSTLAIQFAGYLAEGFGKVVYISGEEGHSKTIKDKFVRNHVLSDNLHVADLRNYDEIIKEIAVDRFHFIFIDSLNNMRIDAEKLKLLRARYEDSALITISQVTKDGKIRGSNEIVHDADIEVIVNKGRAVSNKNRFTQFTKEIKVY